MFRMKPILLGGYLHIDLIDPSADIVSESLVQHPMVMS